MRYIYDLDDVFCENKAKEAVKHEIINILESSKNNSVDIKELFKQARNNIISSISKNYLNNLYKDYNNFESDEAASLDKERKERVEIYNRLNKLRQIYQDLLDRELYSSNEVKKVNEELKEIETYIKAEENVTLIFERQISSRLYHKSPIKSIVFKKADNGKYSIANCLKPYLDRITFDSFPMSSTNIENYDFTGTKGIRIQSWNIKENTLSNAVLKGVTIDCYNNGHLFAIDPTKIDITGTNFTGSKGAVVTLENTKELPENCNLTDAIIVVNSTDDIKRFALENYKENICIKQESTVVSNGIINLDFTDYFNYTGTIEKNNKGYSYTKKSNK